MAQEKTASPAAAPDAAAEKKVQAFYTKAPKAAATPAGSNAPATAAAPVVSLWVTTKTQAKSPDFDGVIGDRRVAGYLHKGPKAGFISFIDSKTGKGADGKFIQVATANVVVNVAGIPKLAIKMVGQKNTIWAECSLKVSQDTLVAAGLDLAIQSSKKEQLAAKKVAGASESGAAAA